jgi:uncharacterized protein YheU (UPF0270 family)
VSDYIEIPPEQLSADVLQSVIEEFITREGTDYGMVELSLEQKVSKVKRQLESGKAVIAFDVGTESCTLLLKDI